MFQFYLSLYHFPTLHEVEWIYYPLIRGWAFLPF